MITQEQKWKDHWSTGPMAHKKIASNAGEGLSTENQNESNRKGEVYSSPQYYRAVQTSSKLAD